MPIAVKTRPKTVGKKQEQAIKQQQAEEQAVVGQEQSLLVMGTVMFAALSCVLYLRGLLDDDSFEDNHIGGTVANPGSQDSAKGLRIKSLKRGGSSEADKLCDYFELGMMDALRRGYLRSAMILIFLNPDEPDNIVETYHLNVFDAAAGGMTFHVGGPKGSAPTTLGAPVTVGEVKKSVKGIIRSLIVATQNMKELPQTRFLDMKLLYQPHTPDDYEPPCFKKSSSDTYYATHSAREVPEKCSVGRFQTGHHGMAIKTSSIVEYLPLCDATDSQAFAGGGKSPSRTTSGRRRRQSEDNLIAADAVKRTCIWDAEQPSKDRSDFDESFQPDLSVFKPIGLKVDGSMQPAAEDVTGRHRERSAVMTPGGGVVSGFPGRVTGTPFSPTQVVGSPGSGPMQVDTELQLRDKTMNGRQDVSKQSQADSQAEEETILNAETGQTFVDGQSMASRGIDTMALLDKQREEAQMAIDVEMESSSTAADAVEILTKRTEEMQVDHGLQVKSIPKASDGMKCCCGDPMSDGLSAECTKCTAWVHAACAGYDHEDSNRIPTDFTCSMCQLEPKLAKMSKASKRVILHKLERLSQFRRLLADPWAKGTHNRPAINEVAIRKKLACSLEDAKVQLDNLVQLGFATIVKPRGKAKAPQSRWLKGEVSRAEYYEYFNPNSRHEQQLMEEADRLVAKDSNPEPEPELEEHVPETQPLSSKSGKPKASRGMELLDVTTEW